MVGHVLAPWELSTAGIFRAVWRILGDDLVYLLLVAQSWACRQFWQRIWGSDKRLSPCHICHLCSRMSCGTQPRRFHTDTLKARQHSSRAGYFTAHKKTDLFWSDVWFYGGAVNITTLIKGIGPLDRKNVDSCNSIDVKDTSHDFFQLGLHTIIRGWWSTVWIIGW